MANDGRNPKNVTDARRKVEAHILPKLGAVPSASAASSTGRVAGTRPHRRASPVGHTGDPWGTLGTETEVTPAVAESVAAVNSIASVLASLPAEGTLADDSRAVVPTHDLARLIPG